MEAYRASPNEQARVANLFDMIPPQGERALDVGTRDGFLAMRLAARYREVVALDLEMPRIEHPRIHLVKGNAARLAFPNRSFDVVLCTEVLEHVPPNVLPAVCREIARVSRGTIIIGVPYRQDLRIGKTTCAVCGKSNPPWGHVNSFDESRLQSLFRDCEIEAINFVGATREKTNAISAALLDFAGNPFGTWAQGEACVHSGGRIGAPRPRTLSQRLATRIAMVAEDVQARFTPVRAIWIHVRFRS